MTLDPVHVAGAGMIRFGKYPREVTLETMGASAARQAMTDAGVGPADIEALYVGHVFGGPVAGQRIGARIGLAGKPVSNHENYCSSGATALREAWIAVGAGLYDLVLVLGVEKMTDRIKGGVQPDAGDLDAASGFIFAAGHALSARRYIADYGATREQIAMVAVKNHAHSVMNPYAHYQKPVSLADVLTARPIAEPLGLLDCSPISDGAAAVVVASQAGLRRLGVASAPKVAGCGLVSGTVQTGLGDVNEEDVSRRAGEEAYRVSGIGADEIDLVEMHDCFTIAEIVRLEGLGVLPRGEGARLTEAGHTSLGGRLPVNPSGGLLSRGHPVGATGVAQICELFWQLTDRAGGRQVEGARTGLAYCKGGSVSGTDGASVTTVIMTR
ncbi:thiolase family protein [Streptomyces rapamycinicus]|uniref:propanoyl-CoA C-acyltransferase n=2 Tax=Streptomyces rapamycinicus TaxID=1226757 RepID=A0A0A0NXE7_STRRN|nr:thiolase family protein [Streptomyces rapamycinicus]AGP61400.1 thiolase [Streptomyces rapamycinicus NRRL 5491]MBB4787420.1 acetyl-CoA acetyltransferase [Streptomyces rapamycinicus]RLV71763.1 thiolase [Streptomyces rapamycinicus NRRL 5491]UTP36860.1 thiolase family protein [Streptomyces rapamycinicus NRRL 5491]